MTVYKAPIKFTVLGLSLLGLFSFILCRNNLKLSLFLQTTGTISALCYVAVIKQDEEWSPLNKAWKELELEREKINNQYVEDCKSHEEQLLEVRKDFEREKNEIKELSVNEQKRIIELFENEIELYTQQLQLKENMLRQAKLPKMATGISRTETYANRIIEFLYSKGCEADYADSWEETTYDLIRLVPKNFTLKQLKEFSEELQLELRLNTSPTFEITQGCLQIKVDTRLISTINEDRKHKLELVTDNWLPQIANKIIHGKVDGETQSGKSTFVCNLANILGEVHQDAEFIAIDPKYPLSLNWDSDLNIWQRKPKYPNIKTALDGLKEVAETIESRLELVGEDVANGKKPRSFNKKVFIIDEIDWIILEYGKDATDLLQVGLKVGAALNVIVVYFGQTPRCSKLKMTRDDFRNSTNISLGSNIPDAIQTYVFDDHYAKELLDLYWQENNKGNVYICLVSQKGKKPFLAQLPKPDEFKPLKNSKHIPDNSYSFLQVDVECIKQLILEGKRDSEIVKSLWGISPSRSDDYQKAVSTVKAIRDGIPSE